MEYARINKLDKDVSKLIFGTAVPKLFAAVAENAGEKEVLEAYALLDEMYAFGINTFDCAAIYGEEILGRWMKDRGIRDKCVIISKCAHPNKWRHRVNDFDILTDASDSVYKLQTECIDIYLLHRDNTDVPVGKIVDVMNRLYEEGKIKIYGGSNWTHERLEEANEYDAKHNLQPFSVSSPNFSLAAQITDPWRGGAYFGNECVTIAGTENKTAREWYTKSGIPVLAYSALARGFFSDKFTSDEPEKAKEVLDEPGITGYYCDENIERLRRCEILAKEKGIGVAQLALAWVYNQNFDVFAVSGASQKKHVEQNIAAMNTKLTEDECLWLNLEKDIL